jgi:CrcB protein
MKMILVIAAGGALGAVARHMVNNQVTAWFGDVFPWGILTVNVAGSFAMGVLVGVLGLAWTPPLEVRAFIVVGFLGAFTTFSTFSLQVALLYDRGQMGLAALYIAASVLLAVGGLFAGLALAKSIVL